MLKHGFKTASFSSTLKFQLKQHKCQVRKCQASNYQPQVDRYIPKVLPHYPLCHSSAKVSRLQVLNLMALQPKRTCLLSHFSKSISSPTSLSSSHHNFNVGYCYSQISLIFIHSLHGFSLSKPISMNWE